MSQTQPDECEKGGCAEPATHIATIRNPFSEHASTSYCFCSWHTDGARDMSRRYHLGTTFVPLNGKATTKAFVMRDHQGNELARAPLAEDGTAVLTAGILS